MAILSERYLPDTPGVHRPPFFVIGYALWLLQEDLEYGLPGCEAPEADLR